MKKILFCIGLFLSLQSIAQKEEKIAINNSRVAFTIEAAVLGTDLKLEGNSKYITRLETHFITQMLIFKRPKHKATNRFYYWL